MGKRGKKVALLSSFGMRKRQNILHEHLSQPYHAAKYSEWQSSMFFYKVGFFGLFPPQFHSKVKTCPTSISKLVISINIICLRIIKKGQQFFGQQRQIGNHQTIGKLLWMSSHYCFQIHK